MDDYRSMYLLLFNAVTDALSMLEEQKTEKAKCLLENAQQACEELFISGGEQAFDALR